MRLRLGLVLLTALPLTVLPSFAAVTEPVVNDRVSDQYHPLALDRQDLSGLFSARIRANIEGYLEPMGKSGTTVADWGGYLDAAANSFNYTHDRTLGEAMTKVAQSALAASSGSEGDNRSQLLGLLSYYRVTGDEAALSKCKRLGDAILAQPAAPASIQSMVTLYRYSGDRRYLDYCQKLIQTLYPPNVTRPLAATSSEDELSQLLGLVEFYRVDGDDAFLQAAITAWHQIVAGRLTATGTLSDAMGNPDSACITLHWMQLTLELFRITGEPQYADALEKTAYNQLLAQQDFKTGQVFTTVPLNGTKSAQPGNKCATSVSRGISMLPALVWGHYGHGIIVNFYTPGHATVRLHRGASVNLYEETTFPEGGDVLLHVEPDHKIRIPLLFPLRLRVPAWADTFTVTAGDQHYTGRRGQYLVIKRQWKRGDTVAIKIGMPVKLVPGSTNDPTSMAIQRGPQILSLSKELNPQIDDFSAFSFPVENVSQETVASSPNGMQGDWQGDQLYRVEGRPKQLLVFLPFADARTYRTTFPARVQSSALD